MPEMNFYSEDAAGRAALPLGDGHKWDEDRATTDHADRVAGPGTEQDHASHEPAKQDATLGGWLDKRDLPWLVPLILCFVIMGIVEVLG